jgi:DNA repair exonuclease SbcCD ATPase subunit
MKIIALQAENVKRLAAIEIRPDGNVVQITGKNGQGKTSVLDAIAWALEGTSHIQAQPIRKGWTDAQIRLEIAGADAHLKVTRKFKAKEDGGYTTAITVENAEGARFPSPQAMLDALVGELAFDPLAFTRMKPADQFETLKRFVPGVDFAEIEAAQKKDFDERTAINRQAKALRAQADGIAVPAGPPPEEIDESALVAELQRAGEHNAEIERRRGNREQAVRDIAEMSAKALDKLAEAERLRAEADAAVAEAERIAAEAGELQKKLDAAGELPTPIDTAELTARIDKARLANKALDAHRQKANILEQAGKAEAHAAELTKKLEERTAAKADAIAKAKMPIDGIGFGDGFVTLDGVPFEQASDAQQLAASIAIAAAMNPKLRVIRVRDGSLLDEDAMKMLAAFADKHDMQVWVERVDSSGTVGFVLEDGRLKGAAPAAATEAA